MIRKSIIAIVLLWIGVVTSNAQVFQKGLFLDDYDLAYKGNPAVVYNKDVLSVLDFANNRRTNIGAAAFLYRNENGLVTALHRSVPAETFLGNLKDDNYLTGDLSMNLFSFGKIRGDSFHTIELNVRGLYSLSIPKSIFEFVKTGYKGSTYDMGRINLQGSLVAEASYGIAKKLSDKVSIGGRAQLLYGLVAVDYLVNQFDLTMSEQQTTADITADLKMTSSFIKFRSAEAGNIDFTKLSSKDTRKLPGGIGLAFDFGVVYKPSEHWTLSASILDVGGLIWRYGNVGQSRGTFSFTGFENVTYDKLNGNDLMDLVKEAGNDFLDTIKIQPGDNVNRFRRIPFQANLGVRYVMPFHERLSTGLTASYFGYQGQPYMESRLCVAEKAWNWLEIMGNAGYGSHGGVFGFAGVVSLPRFRINASMERGMTKYIPGHKSMSLRPSFNVFSIGVTYDI